VLFTPKRGRRAQPVVVSDFCGLHPVKTPFPRAQLWWVTGWPRELFKSYGLNPVIPWSLTGLKTPGPKKAATRCSAHVQQACRSRTSPEHQRNYLHVVHWCVVVRCQFDLMVPYVAPAAVTVKVEVGVLGKVD